MRSKANTRRLAQELLDLAWASDPSSKPRSSALLDAAVRGFACHTEALLAACAAESPQAFANHCRWAALARQALGQRGSFPDQLDLLSTRASELGASPDQVRACLEAATAELGSASASLDPVAIALQEGVPPSSSLRSNEERTWLAAAALAVQTTHHPGAVDELSKQFEDARAHVSALAAALEADNRALFREYSQWTAQRLGFLGQAASLSAFHEALATVARCALPDELGAAIAETITAATESTPITPPALRWLTPLEVLTASLETAPDWHLSAGEDVARLALTLYYRRRPEVSLAQGEEGRAAMYLEAVTHLEHLAEAFRLSSQPLFSDYLAWARCVQSERGSSEAALQERLTDLQEALRLALPDPLGQELAAFVQACDAVVQSAPPPTSIDPSTDLGRLARQFHDLLVSGDRRRASRLIVDAAKAGTSIQDLYLGVFQPSQYEIGRRWQLNEITVAQEHLATAATQLIMSQLYPYVFSAERVELTLVATCSAEDLHELGVRMVCDVFELAGWDTYYLGADCPVQDVLETLHERQADLLAISATLGPHLRRTRALIDRVRADPRTKRVKILVGGLPFRLDPTLWRTLGADGWAQDCGTAVGVGERLVRGA